MKRKSRGDKVEQVLIYPFSDEMIPVVNSSDLLQDLHISSLVCLKGSKNKGELYNIKGKVLRVTDDFEKELKKCSSVWFVNCGLKEWPNDEKYILDRLKKALGDKKVIYSRKGHENEKKMVKMYHDDFWKITTEDLAITRRVSGRQIFNISTPIVLITGLQENIGKFEVQLTLRREFLKSGIKFVQIGSRDYSHLFGMYDFPPFMFSTRINEADKILKFNHFIKEKEQNDRPELIVLGVPGEFMRFDNNITNNFGFLLSEVMQAIVPDFNVLCLPYVENEDDLQRMISLFSYRFLTTVDVCVMANKMVDYSETKRSKEVRYLTIDKKVVDNKIEGFKMDNLFGLKSDLKKIPSVIINKLQQYSNIIIM